MARFLIASTGYWGDVAAFAPLAAGLTQRGHAVDMVAPASMHDMLERENVDLHAAVPDTSPDLYQRDQPALLRHSRLSSSLSVPLTVRRAIIDPLEDAYEALRPLIDKADAVVAHPSAMAPRFAAEVASVPWVTMQLFPMYVPTSTRFVAGLPPRRHPGPLRRSCNRLGWWAYAAGTGVVTDRRLNRFRRRLGLPPVRANLTVGGMSPHAVLVPVSRHYLPPAPDWPAHLHVTGFISWSGGDQAMPAEADRFLRAGEPPVCVTLGSSAANHCSDLFDLFADAADALGVRTLFLIGDEANRGERLSGRDGVVAFAPLDRVLSRCRAVVHSGSLGTNAAALTAGLPAIVAPDLVDQGWHGRRLEQLGAGLVLARRHRTPARARAALARLLDDPAISATAARLGQAIASEDGVARACDHLDALLESR